EVDKAFQVIRAYALLQRDAQTGLFSIHRLVQVILQNYLDKELNRWLARAVYIIDTVFPADVTISTWEACQRYLPHVFSLASIIDQTKFEMSEAAQLVTRAAEYESDQGLFTQAKYLYQIGLSTWERLFPAGHPKIAQTLTDIGGVLVEQSR